MDVSSIIALLVVLGFVALGVAATVRMGRRKAEVREQEPRPATPPPRAEPAERSVQKKPPVQVPAKKPSVVARPGPAKSAEVPEAAKPSRVPAAATVPAAAPREEPKKALIIPFPVVKPLGAGLERTRTEGFVGRLAALFRGGASVDAALLSRVEEVLLTSDIGVKTTGDLLEALRTRFQPSGGDLVREVLAFLKGEVQGMLAGLPHGAPDLPDPPGPAIIMVVGVNGTGKTTTIGKMAFFYRHRGRKVLLGAGDTFRAAGADQLQVWGERVGVPVVSGADRADPGSVLFEAARRARDEGHDLMIADTAGRLHTNIALVEELKKVHRVLGKVVPGAPHEVILVLDATMGQNAVRQAEIFRQAVKVTGIALAKLDGTAKGGVVLSIARDMGVPIRFVGVGEKVQDLRPFDAAEFADALFEEPEAGQPS